MRKREKGFFLQERTSLCSKLQRESATMPVIHDSSTWPDYGIIDPQLEKFLEAHPELRESGFGDCLDVPAAQERLLQEVAHAPPPDTSGVDKSEIRIPVRDGSHIRAILYKPQTKPVAGSPFAVLFHGGGWCIGLPEMEEPTALLLAKHHGAVVISVGYRKAPEYRFPTAIHDSWDALKWCSEHASTLDAISSKGFLIGGGSAGGNIAAVLSHLARDENISPPLTAVYLQIPFTCAAEAIPERYKVEFTSYEQNANAPGLDLKAVNFFREHYQGDASSELFSPMLWPSGHKDLPKTYLQICGLDPLRDDGLLYERELRNAKVPTRVDVYPGVPHGFEGKYHHLDLASKAVRDKEIAFDWLLERDSEAMLACS